ncbi:transport and Golgi organization protein 2 homolog [Ylistrum balloti]|uniref:transport and Golgi organization protein 2 homolog n=1 Tax=Ylistrum balloti TaxID=509963 RepID=UPI002905AD3C|nr:transport and Golgi organization protein 2 homolog [Ylistrum balloti]
MCLLFLYICDTATDDNYRLILANNRDEYWDRPTALAGFWGPNKHILSGVDMEPRRERGTWLAVSKAGRIGALLNIPGTQKHKQCRGMLIPDYLNGELTACQYLTQKIQPIHRDFKTFNLVLIDLRSRTTSATYYNNKTDSKISLPNGVYGFDNSVLDEAWQKTVHGRFAFHTAVQKYGRKDDKDQLVRSIFNILSDSARFPEDKHLNEQAKDLYIPENIRLAWSSTFVWSPSIRHGTRTSTILLVDKFGECEYIERTFKIPVNPYCLKYQTKFFRLKLY